MSKRLGMIGLSLFVLASCRSSATPETNADAAVATATPAVAEVAARVLETPSFRFHREADGYRVEPKSGLPKNSTAQLAELHLPRTADGAFEVRREAMSVSAKLVGALPIEPRFVGDRARYEGALAGATIEHAPSHEGTEEWITYDAAPKSYELRYDVKLTGVAGLRLAADTLELLDAAGIPRLRVTRPIAEDRDGGRTVGTLALEGCQYDRDTRAPWGRPVVAPGADHCTLVAHWSDKGLSYPVTVDPAWVTTGSLSHARARATAVVTGGSGASPCVSGCFLIVGGDGTSPSVPEAYHSASGTFTDVPFGTVTFLGNLGVAGANLGNGTMVFAGGAVAGGVSATNSVALWDASAGWTQLNNLPTSIGYGSGGMLSGYGNSTILNGAIIMGGQDATGTATTTVMAYKGGDPGFSAAPSMTTARSSAYVVTSGYTSTGATLTACAVAGDASNDADCAAFVAPTSATWVRYVGALSNTPDAMAWSDGLLQAMFVSNTGSLDVLDTSKLTCATPPCAAFHAISATATPGLTGRVGAYGFNEHLFTGGSRYVIGLGFMEYATVDYVGPSYAVSTGAMVNGRVGHSAGTIGAGVLVVGGQNVGVPRPRPFSSAEIFAPVGKGSACLATGECTAGLQCADGVCCDSACTGTCEACNLTSSVGTCTPVPAAQQPAAGHTACPTPTGGTCGYACDGSNRTSCKPGGTGVTCAAATCSGSTLTQAAMCSGTGSCNTPTTKGCAPYQCNAAGTDCRTTCAVNGDCTAGNRCDSTGHCVSTGAAGAVCNPSHTPSDCNAGLSCVDNVCCTTSSCTAPFKCNVSGAAGTCKLPNGVACTGTVSDCGSGICADGVCCNAACTGQCEQCNAVSSAGTCTQVPYGQEPVTTAGTTRTTCTGSGKCQAFCDGSTRTACAPPPGTTVACAPASCTGSSLTGISYCDGLGGCNTPSPGRCDPYACGSSSSCKLSCSTASDCATGYVCKSGVCTTTGSLGTVCTDPSQCKSGHCAVSDTTDKMVCCTVDSCATGSFCGDSSTSAPGTCVKKNGQKCAALTECASGTCVDGLCCDSACSGQCEACDVVGAEGKCSAVTGTVHTASGARTACPKGSDVCGDLACDGSKDRTKCVGFVHGPETACGSSCSGSTYSAGKCDGAGSCGSPKASACTGGFVCDSTTGACKTRCAVDGDCQSGFACKGSACVPATGTCSADRTTSTSADGKTVQPCAPYLCQPGSGTCATTCASSIDCQTGSSCGSDGKCTALTGTGSSGGCAVGTVGGRGDIGVWAVALVVIGAVGSRRKRAA